MAIDIGNIIGKTTTVEVEHLGEKAVITYDPSALTQSAMQAGIGGTNEEFSEFFIVLVKDWDLLMDGAKVPLTKEGLESIPIFFLRIIFKAIMTEAASGEQGKAFSSGSRRKAPSDRRPTGTKSSKPRATSK